MVVLFTFYSNAQIVTDRPDQTESATTIPKNALQIESGLLISYQNSIKNIVAPTNLFKYGITKGTELRLLNQFESVDNNQGFSDIQLGTKIQVIKQNDLKIAFLSHFVLPTGSKYITNNRFGTINKISIAHDLSENSTLGYNFGYDYLSNGNGNLTYSIAFGVAINKKTGVYIEPYGSFENLSNFVLNADSGFTYLIQDNLQFDFSFGTGINHKMNYMSIGCSWLLKK